VKVLLNSVTDCLQK